MISPKDVKKAAELSRLKLSAKEEKELSRELESILGYIDKLKEVNVSGVAETSHVFHVNDFREDIRPKEIFDSSTLLEAVPETERGFVKVKKILDRE